ncbi:MAG: ParB/RepB/Spo0J family partition protein [Deltaproteobacteria bacterium]|nr:ParB/RepB/Spo0J family partition protein [Deltaproteobacteria bacterium]MBW2302243.1 ParB/RepB/Spo0J family partition protein [Deltaproteobacteria bacterium]
MSKRRALGKGLSALIPDAGSLEEPETRFFMCPVESITPNPYQPRQDFREEDLQEMVRSVKEKGILTPLLVSREGDGYRLIAGERRWRAAQKAGLEKVPVVVRETTPAEALELALIENIHRKDLNPIEEAQAYKRWLEDTRTTQETLAKKLGKDRSTIANMLRLLTLPPVVQKDLIEGRLSMGHARVLAGIKGAEKQKALRDVIIKKALSVRQTEALVKKQGEGSSGSEKKKSREPDDYMRSLADTLKRSLGTKVEIERRGKKGRITIYFYSDDEFDRLFELLS